MYFLSILHVYFIFTARCYAERGIATAICLSVCLSVALRYRDHIGWNNLRKRKCALLFCYIYKWPRCFLTAELFANDVKVYVVIDDVTKVHVLRDGLNILKRWSEMWQLDLSLHTCLILHIGNDDKKNSSVCQSYILLTRYSYLQKMKLSILV